MGCSESKRSQNHLSKMPSLFNYKLKGEWDQQVKAKNDLEYADHQKNPIAQVTPETVNLARQTMSAMVKQIYNLEVFTQYLDKCQTESKEFDATPFGSDNTALTVLVHRPKQFRNEEKNRGCIIYAHGGGAFMMCAQEFSAIGSRMALENDIIVVNVDYRLAPQAKAPKGIFDFYAAVKWTIKNSEELGIDSKRICLMGDSGGGYISAGACMKLVENNQEDLVKLYVAIVPMTSDYYIATKKEDMNQIEQRQFHVMNQVYKFLAEDPDKQKNDRYIFPDKMGDKIAERFPKTVVFTGEFDFLRKSSQQLAGILRRNGRLLDICIRDGVDHSFYAYFHLKKATEHFNDVKKVLQKWLL